MDIEPNETNREPERPTLKTIAFMTGLGVTTVSRALKDAPDIGEDTKKRVRLVAAGIGYRPNRAGIRLRTGKTNVIGVILDTSEDSMGYVAAIVHGISERIRGTPYHLVITPHSLSTDPMEPVRYIVETGSADGVILARTEPQDPRVAYLQSHRMPFATHGRTLLPTPHAFYDFDNAAFARIAVNRLVARGRTRIGLIAPPPALTFHRHMAEGLAQAVAAHRVIEVPLHGIELDTRIDEVMQRAVALAQREDMRPDGIVSAGGSAALAFVAGYETQGLKLGTDFDVVSKETMPLQHLYQPALLTIPEDFREAGRCLADAVLKAIEGGDPAQLQMIATPAEGEES